MGIGSDVIRGRMPGPVGDIVLRFEGGAGVEPLLELAMRPVYPGHGERVVVAVKDGGGLDVVIGIEGVRAEPARGGGTHGESSAKEPEAGGGGGGGLEAATEGAVAAAWEGDGERDRDRDRGEHDRDREETPDWAVHLAQQGWRGRRGRRRHRGSPYHWQHSWCGQC